jgi:hypothetical protein
VLPGRQANSTRSAQVLPPLAANSKSEGKVNSLPPLGFEPVIFGMLAHLSNHSAKSHPMYLQLQDYKTVETHRETKMYQYFIGRKAVYLKKKKYFIGYMKPQDCGNTHRNQHAPMHFRAENQVFCKGGAHTNVLQLIINTCTKSGISILFYLFIYLLICDTCIALILV